MSNKPTTRAENLDILHDVARARGVTASGLNTLEHIMYVESSGKQFAANDRSTARGCFQFIEDTWLGTLKTHGAKFGLGKYEEHIVQATNRKGQKYWTIHDPKMREEALNLRYDVRISCEMGIALTQDNEKALSKALGRAPSSGELYLGHFLGSARAIQVLQHADVNTPISSLLSREVIDANIGVSLKKGSVDKPFAQFTVADIQQWAARKMQQELSYDQLDEQNRRASWRRRNPRQVPQGKPDDYSDMEEATGDMTMVEAIIQFVVQLGKGIMTAIGSIIGASDDTPAPPAPTPPASRVAAVGNAPARPRG
jgi:hypothetical protein